jgi:hypothetical protein
MSALQKETVGLTLLNLNDQKLAQTLKRVESTFEKRFDKIEGRSEKTNHKIEILAYFLIADIIFCFLILGTMRGWF